tara:strand:+ start:300 stop:419 length:120 start_codon:yes stop_codon:yes gene_type:complete
MPEKPTPTTVDQLSCEQAEFLIQMIAEVEKEEAESEPDE